jgi:hypothetical protein
MQRVLFIEVISFYMGKTCAANPDLYMYQQHYPGDETEFVMKL